MNRITKVLIGTAFVQALVFSSFSLAQEKTMNFNFKNANLVDVVAKYQKTFGGAVLFESKSRGKVTAFNDKPLSQSEAFYQLSYLLSSNGMTYSESDGVIRILDSRSAQRDDIPVITELPASSPNRLFTLIYKVKKLKATDLEKQLRIIPSRDGEWKPVPKRNAVIVTDYYSNLKRVVALFEKIDR